MSNLYVVQITHSKGDGEDCYGTPIHNQLFGDDETLTKHVAVAVYNGGQTWAFVVSASTGHLFMAKIGSYGNDPGPWTTADLSNVWFAGHGFDTSGVMAATMSDASTPMLAIRDSPFTNTAVVFQDDGANQPNNSWQKLSQPLFGGANTGGNIAITWHTLVHSGNIYYADSIYTVAPTGHLYQAEVYFDANFNYGLLQGVDVGGAPSGAGFDHSTSSLAASFFNDTTGKTWSVAYARSLAAPAKLYQVISDRALGGATTSTPATGPTWASTDTFQGQHTVYTTPSGSSQIDHIGGFCHDPSTTICEMQTTQGTSSFNWLFLP